MTITIKTTRNNDKWTAYHNKWGVASGRMHTLLWNSRQEVDEWIKLQNPHVGHYSPIPWILPQDLVGAEVD